MTLAFRHATEADIVRLIAIHQSAFPDDRGEPPRHRNFAHNPLGTLKDLFVASEGEQLLGHAFLFRLSVYFGGVAVPVGGIASLGVAPEARGRGVARALLSDLHATSFARGDALTMLYPFRPSFYARDGYGPVSPFVALELSPRAVPRAWSTEGAGTVRAATGVDRGAMERLQRRQAERRSGTLVRPVALWERKLVDEHLQWFVFDRGSSLAGYVALSRHQREPHAPITLTIEELASEDDAARRRLLALAGAQRDQVARLRLFVSEGDPLALALADGAGEATGTAKIEHPLGTLCAGPMVRIHDVEQAVGARGYPTDGQVEVRLPDRVAHIEARGGRARVKPSTGAPWIKVAPSTFASILYGSLSPSAGASLGWVDSSGPDAIEAADTLFRLPPFFAEDSF